MSSSSACSTPQRLASPSCTAPGRRSCRPSPAWIRRIRVQRWPAGRAVRVGPGAGDKPPVPAQQRLRSNEEAPPARPWQDAAERGEQRPVGGLQLGTWDLAAEDHELVAQDEDLHVLSGVTAGEQHEQLDGTAQREVGELRQHQDGLPGRGSRAPPYRAVDANWQLNGHVRLCAPFRQQEGLVAVAAKEIVGHGASYLFAPLTPNVLVLKRQTTE